MKSTVLYLASDLIWATKIKSTADALGVPARPVRNVDMLRARLADTQVGALLLDLDAAETAWLLLETLHEHQRADDTASADGPGRIVTLAWGPHVATDLMADAKARGVETVMTRGAFNSSLPKLLESLSSPQNPV